MFCLVDGNNFYVSCERVFNPKLISRPVIVLSNNDGCVVSRSNEAKAIGIKMGEPYHKCKQLVTLNKVKVLSSNYTLYADMSARIVGILKAITPDLEVYSIDESFLLLQINSNDCYKQGEMIKQLIRQQTGIPVGVGFGKTKTLAKIANMMAKRLGSGVCCIHDYDIKKVLRSVLIDDVWGIGKGVGKRLRRQGIYNAWQLREASLRTIRSSCHSYGERLKLELMGISVIKLATQKNPNKQIISSRSFGVGLTDREQLYAALTENIMRATEKLRAQYLKVKRCYAFVQTSQFQESYHHHGVEVVLPLYSSVTSYITQCILSAISVKIKENVVYTKSGIVLSELISSNELQPSLFDNQQKQVKLDKLMKAYDAINQRWGRGSIIISRAHQERPLWRMRQRYRSDQYTSSKHQLIIAKS